MTNKNTINQYNNNLCIIFFFITEIIIIFLSLDFIYSESKNPVILFYLYIYNSEFHHLIV